jgi:hypothetical protein
MSDFASTPSRLKISWLIGTLAAFALFAVIAVYSARMTRDYEDYDQMRADARYDTLAKLRADANKTLSTADWVDQDKGTVRIPIQEAMVEEVETLKSQPAAMGVAIPGAIPPPAAKTGAESGPTNASASSPTAPTVIISTGPGGDAASPPAAQPKP